MIGSVDVTVVFDENRCHAGVIVIGGVHESV